MKDRRSVKVDMTSDQALSRQNFAIFLNPRRLLRPFRLLVRWLIQDWYTHKYLFFAVLLLLLTVIPTVAYYLNHPRPGSNADTPSYLNAANSLQAHPYQLVNIGRLPGYPLLIVLVYTLAGQGNLVAVSITQAVFFVLATLEIYVLVILLLRRSWLAFLIGLLVGTNLVLLSFVKPIMSEGLALWLLTTLALAVVYFTRTLRVQAFWLVAACIPPLFLTRPEWIYLPVPLFAYLLLVATRRDVVRHLLRHALLSFALIYVILGSYIGINALVNHYPGLTLIENFNLMGKVLQYNMQDEASPEYTQTVHELDICVARIDRDPYHVLPCIPSLSRNRALPAGDFARSIILHHPLEFLLKSVPFFSSSLTNYYDSDTDRVAIPGPFDWPLAWLKSVHRMLYRWNACFPLCVITWFLLLCMRRTKSLQVVAGMGGIVLLALYGLIVTTLGGYRPDDYMRFHIVFDPLLIVVVCGSLLIGVQLIVQKGRDMLKKG